LVIAAAHSNIDAIKSLLAAKAEIKAIDVKIGRSALEIAAEHRHLDAVALLLESHADVNAQGGHYGTALQAASSKGHYEIVKALFGNTTWRVQVVGLLRRLGPSKSQGSLATARG
jgi:ankyrin repeat protein